MVTKVVDEMWTYAGTPGLSTGDSSLASPILGFYVSFSICDRGEKVFREIFTHLWGVGGSAMIMACASP